MDLPTVAQGVSSDTEILTRSGWKPCRLLLPTMG